MAQSAAQSTIDLPGHDLVAMSRPALAALRDAMLRECGPDSAAVLREAGYAGGEAVFASFERWVRERGGPAPEEMSVEEFETFASTYFRETGWGTLAIGSLRDAVATIDSADWSEADPTTESEAAGCHFTTGLFADFFGRISDEPLAVLEVECRSAGHERCRFLLGSGAMMTKVYEEMAEGAGYDEALSRV